MHDLFLPWYVLTLQAFLEASSIIISPSTLPPAELLQLCNYISLVWRCSLIKWGWFGIFFSVTDKLLFSCSRTSWNSRMPSRVNHLKPCNWTMLRVRFTAAGAVCVSAAWMHTVHPLARIGLSVCISSDASQKRHITRLSLHPEEGPFHARMLLAELRRIFLTVSLTLCWQTEKHPHVPKRCREQRGCFKHFQVDKPN